MEKVQLTLRYIKLKGGDVSGYHSYPDYWGGAIYIGYDGGDLLLYSSILTNNKAFSGGGLFSKSFHETPQKYSIVFFQE